MTLRFEWSTELPNVGVLTVRPPWNWSEYRLMADFMIAQLSAMQCPVAGILDMSSLGRLPHDYELLEQIRYIQLHRPENLVAQVIVSKPKMVITFMVALAKLQPKHLPPLLYAMSLNDVLSQLRGRLQHIASQANP